MCCAVFGARAVAGPCERALRPVDGAANGAEEDPVAKAPQDSISQFVVHTPGKFAYVPVTNLTQTYCMATGVYVTKRLWNRSIRSFAEFSNSEFVNTFTQM